MPTALYSDAPRLPEGEGLDLRSLVSAGAAGVEVEIGPGRGWFILERLESAPGVGVVGLEIRRKWATIVDRRLAERGLGARARVFAEDAREVFPRLLTGSLAAVYLHFPDPWWKKRHAKRLVLTPALARELGRALRPGGELFVQTDVSERAEAYEALLAGEPTLEPWDAAGPRVDDNPYQARSPRERRALADGLPVVRLRYRRAGARRP